MTNDLLLFLRSEDGSSLYSHNRRVGSRLGLLAEKGYDVFMRYSKYRAVPTFRDGIRFHSKKEADRYVQLKMLEKAGKISWLQWQVPYSLQVFDTVIGKYVADFIYTENGVIIVEDVKGVLTPLYKWKKRHFEAQYRTKIKET